MNLVLDEKVIESSVNEMSTKAIQGAFQSYDVQSKVRESVANALVGDVLATAMTKAVAQLDLDGLTQVLAKEIMRNTTAAVVAMITENCVGMVYKLRGYGDYEKDKHKIMDEIRAEIRAACIKQ